MKRDKAVVAVAVADVHLCHKPPPAREGEPDWYAAMLRPLNQIRELWRKHNAPILYAGDLFDTPRPPLELVNWALEHLPPGFAVPGNHDLPNHSYAEIGKSAYWTMCLHGKIRNLDGKPVWTDGMTLHGFPVGASLTPCPEPVKEFNLHVAVVHRYIWTRGFGHDKATDDQLIGNTVVGKGYEVYVFGDNHQHFINNAARTVNCGSLMRRRVDQSTFQPKATLIHADGTLTPVDLDYSADVFSIKAKEAPDKPRLELDDFAAGVEALADSAYDFPDAVRRGLDDGGWRKGVRNFTLSCLEKDK